jgi:ABC-type amino acid transport substrate-binding protein
MKRIAFALAAVALIVGAVVWRVKREISPPIETIVASSLQSLLEQNRLSVFAARFVTAVTSSKSQFGLSAEKTMIVPAMVRYEVDLAKLTPQDLGWDAETKTLKIALPPVQINGPEFDLEQTREYESGMVLMTLTDVEKLLDAQNRGKARADILQQAQSEVTMKLAREAAVRAVSNNFILPLRAAGVEARVMVEFRP